MGVLSMQQTTPKKNILARKPPVEFTVERKMMFLELYRKTGLLSRSAELTGVTTNAVREHRSFDPVFDEMVEDAHQCWIDEVLVQNAIKRATVGTQKPIVGGKDRDQIVAYETQYSDALHLALLKSKRPEFKDKGNATETEQRNGGVLIVTNSPVHIDHWETLYGDMADGSKAANKEQTKP